MTNLESFSALRKRRRPLNYYDELRDSRVTAATSTIDEAGKSSLLTFDDLRMGHLVSLRVLSKQGGDSVDERVLRTGTTLDVGIAAVLAIHHFNERSSAVIPGLADRIGDCNIFFTMDVRDTYGARRQTSRQFLEAVNAAANQERTNPVPTGIVGTAWTQTAFPSSILGGAFEVPQVSCCATAKELSGVDSPMFARTVPTNAVDSEAAAEYYRSKNITHVAVLNEISTYGQNYASDFRAAAEKRDITVISATFTEDDPISLRAALERIQQSRIRYIFGIFGLNEYTPITFKGFAHAANDAGLIGYPHTWLFGESMNSLASSSLTYDAKDDAVTIKALNGSGVLSIHIANDRFEEALKDFRSDTELQDYFKSRHIVPELFDGYNLAEADHGRSIYSKLNYDATMALALSACQAEKSNPKGTDILKSLLNTSFDGSSGFVQINNETRSRVRKGLQFRVRNIFAEDPTNDGVVNTLPQDAVTIDFIDEETVIVREDTPFMFAGCNSPKAIPEPDVDENLIPDSVLAFGLTLCVVLLCLSVAWTCWVVYYRKQQAVKAAQPLFLVMLCSGCFIMATAIIPMGFQEPMQQNVLDGGCAAVPWLLSVGFTMALSALFSKIWRIDKVHRASARFQRVEIKPRDVLLPFAILMTINIILLMAWTVISPMQWRREGVQGSRDSFGRSISTVGTCQTSMGESWYSWSLAFLNFVALLFAVVQSYLARHLPTMFNESFYVALSLVSMLEASIVGVPLLWLVTYNPSANYMLRSVMVTIFCLAILLPIFVPKAKLAHQTKRRHGVNYDAAAAAAAAIEASEQFMSANRSMRPDCGRMAFSVVH